jgi:hypothetical protein
LRILTLSGAQNETHLWTQETSLFRAAGGDFEQG